jgi:hypothetical protein
MKKTAVQEMIDIVQMDMNNGVEISMEVFMGMLKKAKEMEKQQIIDAYRSGKINQLENSELYYNETFKQQEQ